MHLVQVLPNRGATVRVPSRRELQEIYAVRARLEAFACELAAQQITDRSLAELDTAQELVERALELEHDALQNTEREAAFNAQITQANELFHGVIHRVADNERLRVLINELQWYFPKDYVWRAQRSSEEIRALNIEEHLTIRNALAARVAASAARAMEKHIVHAGTLLLAYLDEPGTKGPEA
jgi:DNA-binding GntR family transcriptional regulator